MSVDGLGGDDRLVLRLFVSGASPRSLHAIDNLRRLLERDGPAEYDLLVIDLYQDPQAALDYQVVAAPTLVRVSPAPIRRIIGDLSDTGRLMHGLGITATHRDAQ